MNPPRTFHEQADVFGQSFWIAAADDRAMMAAEMADA